MRGCEASLSLPVALLLLLVQLLLLSSFSDAFVHISGVYHTSVSSSARSSSAASSSLQSSSAQSSSAFSSSPVSSSLLPSSAAASSSALSSSSSSAAADSSDDLSSSTGVASATSDPRLVGWWGQSFYVSGAVGGVYNLLSDRSVQLNAYVVQLQHIRCPVLDGRAMQRCFDEQGTYFGVLAIALRTGEGELQHVRMTGGAYDVGFHSVTVTVTVGDMQQRHELQVGEQYDGVAAAVTRVASSATVTTSNDSTPTSASADWRLHPTLSVQRTTTHQLLLTAGLYSFVFDSVDLYVDVSSLHATCWQCLVDEAKPTGLLGRTWDRRVDVQHSDAEVEQYRERRDDILGCDHMHDRFCAQQRKATVGTEMAAVAAA